MSYMLMIITWIAITQNKTKHKNLNLGNCLGLKSERPALVIFCWLWVKYYGTSKVTKTVSTLYELTIWSSHLPTFNNYTENCLWQDAVSSFLSPFSHLAPDFYLVSHSIRVDHMCSYFVLTHWVSIKDRMVPAWMMLKWNIKCSIALKWHSSQ